MTYLSLTKDALKIMSAMLGAMFISACSSTTKSGTYAPHLQVNNKVTNSHYFQSIDLSCEQQASDMDKFAQQSGQASQYLATAKVMLRCVNHIQFAKGHPDADKALRLMAMSLLNLVKGGDIDGAQIALKKIQSTFPNKDLYFADYSSFFDTASALLNHQKLSRQQMAALNISANLRTEIQRHQHWLSH